MASNLEYGRGMGIIHFDIMSVKHPPILFYPFTFLLYYSSTLLLFTFSIFTFSPFYL